MAEVQKKDIKQAIDSVSGMLESYFKSHPTQHNKNSQKEMLAYLSSLKSLLDF